MIDQELLDSYKNTHFCVNTKPQAFILKAGCYSAELEALHKKSNVLSSAYITAYNPVSEPQSAAWNSNAQKALESEVLANGFKIITGSGVDPCGEWPAEESVLILGIEKDQALKLGARFRQNALLFTANDSIPTLIFPALPSLEE